ncbi:MAG: hypothetical protein M3O70_14810 [Actinomycetota bacterium]|nr:hypothetical protein [Actinomycetota bacterium]
MTVVPLRPRTTADAAGGAAGEVFLRMDDRLLTARQVVVALASYLAEFGDNFQGEVEPIHAIAAQVCYGDLDGWQQICTPQQRTALLARAEQIARDYFGHAFPGGPLVSRL